MRRIERTTQFKRDYKRKAKGQHRSTLDLELMPIVKALAWGHPLQPGHRDHALTGNWRSSLMYGNIPYARRPS